MKKKITAVALIVALLAIALIGGTMAYFTDTKEADNVFTVGNVSISLTEPNWVASGSKDAPEVYPGEALKKDPTVTNTGKNPCFVRIKVTGLDCLGENNMITYETDYVTGALGEGWTLYTDGYFYYNTVLTTETDTNKTTALFDQIRIPTTLTNEKKADGSFTWDNSNLAVKVTAEAVQAQGARPSWSAVQTMSVAEIAAWFTTCMGTAE